ncbi:MAG: bifunctional hydroxymethylpyrimidine kinase/phosphomethylpyrimidine kinase, partial [Halomonas sp.]
RALNAPYVLLKGGHLRGANCPDLMITPQHHTWLTAPRIDTENLHGTGCALSSAIAACLAKQPASAPANAAVAAISEAKQWLHAALEASARLNVGKGRGPVHHFHAWW